MSVAAHCSIPQGFVVWWRGRLGGGRGEHCGIPKGLQGAKIPLLVPQGRRSGLLGEPRGRYSVVGLTRDRGLCPPGDSVKIKCIKMSISPPGSAPSLRGSIALPCRRAVMLLQGFSLPQKHLGERQGPGWAKGRGRGAGSRHPARGSKLIIKSCSFYMNSRALSSGWSHLRRTPPALPCPFSSLQLGISHSALGEGGAGGARGSRLLQHQRFWGSGVHLGPVSTVLAPPFCLEQLTC